MRKPKNSAELFHYWAHQVLPEAKCGNVRYDGPVLYSYAEPIAILLSNDRVLISNQSFSMTTGGHQSEARRATNHTRVCYAPYLTRCYNDAVCLNEMHRKNREHWEHQAENAVVELQRHPRRKKSVADRIASAVSSYNHYREFFELDWPEMTSEEMRKLVEETAKQRAAEQLAAEKRREEQRRIAEAEEATELLMWRDHATDRRSFTRMALRLSLDGKEIETTRGARVPVECARGLWDLSTYYRRKQASTHFRGVTAYKVGLYSLDAVDSDGTLVIGCHTIPYDELELMARKLNFITENSNGVESDRIEVDGSVCGAGVEAGTGEHRSAA